MFCRPALASTVQPQASHLTSLCLTCLIYKMNMAILERVPSWDSTVRSSAGPLLNETSLTCEIYLKTNNYLKYMKTVLKARSK